MDESLGDGGIGSPGECGLGGGVAIPGVDHSLGFGGRLGLLGGDECGTSEGEGSDGDGEEWFHASASLADCFVKGWLWVEL